MTIVIKLSRVLNGEAVPNLRLKASGLGQRSLSSTILLVKR